MNIPIQPDSGPINMNLFLGSVFGISTWAFWPVSADQWQNYAICAMTGIGAMAGLGGGASLILRDYRMRRNIAESEAVSDDHGSAHESEWDDIAARGMDAPISGNLLGLYEGRLPVFVPPKTPFSLIEMPPGVGKTTCFVVGSILHKAKQGTSLCIADVKQELGPMLIPALREMGIEVWAVNPTGAYVDLVGNVELHPYQALLDAVRADDDRRLDAVKMAADYANLHLPEREGEKNPYFTQGSRRVISAVILIKALIDPVCCTPSDIFAVINDPEKLISLLTHVRGSLEAGDIDAGIFAHIRSEAANLLHRAGKNEENFASFLEGASQRFLSFSPGGRLGSYGRSAIFNIADLRQRQIVMFLMTPLSHMREFAPFISLMNENLLIACKANPVGHPVHIVAEEALNYRFNDLASAMEVMRGLGVSMDIYIQSFAGLQRQYGKETAAAIESYADVKIYAGLNSFDRAKHVSDMLSKSTRRKHDFNYQAELKSLGISSGELGRHMRQPDEVLTQSTGKAWAFVRGMHPTELTMVHYGEVSPWRDLVGENPIEGAPLRGDQRFHIHYRQEADAS